MKTLAVQVYANLTFYFLFQIIFPDLKDQNILSIKQSQVTITGSIDDVYLARQQLIVRITSFIIISFHPRSC